MTKQPASTSPLTTALPSSPQAPVTSAVFPVRQSDILFLQQTGNDVNDEKNTALVSTFCFAFDETHHQMLWATLI